MTTAPRQFARLARGFSFSSVTKQICLSTAHTVSGEILFWEDP